MHGTLAHSFRSSLAAPSIASKARKFKPPVSTPTSHANPPPVHPRPPTSVPSTGDHAAVQGSLNQADPPPNPQQPRAIPRATPFDAPRRGAAQRRPGEYREPPAVAAARSKSVGERSVWESYLVLNWQTRLYLWLGLGAFALVGLYGGDYFFPETAEEKAARGELAPDALPKLAGQQGAPRQGAAAGDGATRERGGVGTAAGKQV
ncbi:hypothetical protein JCM8208_006658 [Rhodotorula glutinis]